MKECGGCGTWLIDPAPSFCDGCAEFVAETTPTALRERIARAVALGNQQLADALHELLQWRERSLGQPFNR